MAEIRVERKGPRNIWPWVVGALVVLLVLWFLLSRNRHVAATSGMMTPSSPATAEVPARSEAPFTIVVERASDSHTAQV